MSSAVRRRFRSLLPLAILAATASGEVTRTTHDGWTDSLRISNGTVDLVVVPAVGRIMRYGWIDGENLLWRHPDRAGHLGLTRENTWANVGGDKIWPWPDHHWPAATGETLRDIDPPTEWEHAPHRAEITGPLSVRMVSPVWKTQGLRVVRDIALADDGTRLTLTTRFERDPAMDGATPAAIVPWSVTQLARPDAVVVDYTPGEPRAYGQLLGMSWSSALEPDRTTLWLPSPGSVSKIGVTGRALGWWRGDQLLIQRLVAPEPDDAWKPYEQAQVFWAEDPGEGATPYVELEFTAPVTTKPTALTVTWELHRLRSSRPTMDEVLATFLFSQP